ncbi:MAG: hypothetical protein HF300_05710 [Ignavibacteria bacterium]|jgi:hypothetical protein|nr:hypothetical protein [Ignavibacteria bacterium]MCU7498772.1 hypothetical protein [Ignavibacteria bacterium]MCU7512034.1 hypothetical protein [Ignavibacteria bacterium]MCU7520567.1 hypothetical protein [Ignavibacteria bacterium]MCU7523465.1 hypothetical protein [Ignavibacteria bacterium]
MLDTNVKAWVVSADMGYGHQRAVYPFKYIAENGIITVGATDLSAPSERKLWRRMLGTYELFSRARGIPVVGKPIFGILDSFLHIPSFYPMRDLSRGTLQVSMLLSAIRKGLCLGMFEKIRQKHLPLLTSFYAPAIAADLNGYDKIYCIICDADLNRVWVSKNPFDSRIEYFAPCAKAAQRLKAYGVPDERIFLTGFPVSDDLLGGKDLPTLRSDLGQRLFYLDPKGRFHHMHGRNVEYFLGKENCEFRQDRKLTITYGVGGAGAQKEIGGKIAFSLRKKLAAGEIKLNLVAGIRKEVKEYFDHVADRLPDARKSIEIIYDPDIQIYFKQFNDTVRKTDILWTKPSELSFYSGLGLPIVMTPALGSQEIFNREWLTEINAGIRQEDPDYTDQWLFDFLDSGRLAEAAWSGFLKARKLGTYKILEVLETGKMEKEVSPVFR